MPGHYGGGKGKKAPKGTHRMKDGTLMSGEKHTKDSKPVKETGVAKSGKAKPKAGNGKGSKAMKERMAKLRAMKKKK